MLLRSVVGWLRAAHPFPIAAVLSLTAFVALASSDGDVNADRLGRVLLAMLLSQLAIGWTNDYRDRDADRLYQPSKPVPSGLVDSRWLPKACVLVLMGSLAVGVTLGVVPLALLVVGTAAGLAYDFGVKDTRWSWLPYVVALAVLPPFVWSALDLFRRDFLWLYAVGPPLAVAAHVANVLPDIDADRAAGRRGIGVVLGRSRALALLAVCMLAPLVVLAVTALWVRYDAAVLAVTVAVYVALAGAAAAAYRGRREALAFRCVVLAAVVFAGGWLAAV